MFGIDFSEILVIFGIALVVLGPEKLPKLAASIGRWVGRARTMARQFREQLEQEANSIKRSTDFDPPPHQPVPDPITPAAPAASEPGLVVPDGFPMNPLSPEEPHPAPPYQASAPAPEPAMTAMTAAGPDESTHHPAPPPAEAHERGQ